MFEYSQNLRKKNCTQYIMLKKMPRAPDRLQIFSRQNITLLPPTSSPFCTLSLRIFGGKWKFTLQLTTNLQWCLQFEQNWLAKKYLSGLQAQSSDLILRQLNGLYCSGAPNCMRGRVTVGQKMGVSLHS